MVWGGTEGGINRRAGGGAERVSEGGVRLGQCCGQRLRRAWRRAWPGRELRAELRESGAEPRPRRRVGGGGP